MAPAQTRPGHRHGESGERARRGEPPFWFELLPPALRELPADLAATVALVLLTDLAVLEPVVRETPLRLVVGLLVPERRT